jgi:hypothetical protein
MRVLMMTRGVMLEVTVPTMRTDLKMVMRAKMMMVKVLGLRTTVAALAATRMMKE